MASNAKPLPRRSSTLFEKSGATVRRLARKISLSVLNPREKAPSSVVSVRSGTSGGQDESPPPERSKSRLARWRSSRPPAVSSVVEERDEELIRSATPRGMARRPTAQAADDGDAECALAVPWKIPTARVFRPARGGGQPEHDVAPLVYGRKATELWFPTGDTLIYLCSKSEAHRYQPSFRLSGATLCRKSEFFSIALSARWQEHGESHRQLLAREGAKHILYFPPWADFDDAAEEADTRRLGSEADLHELLNQLVATRNFFAYLFGRHAVCLEDPLGASMLSDFMDRMEMYVLGSNADVKARPTREQTLGEIEAWLRSRAIDDPRGAPQRLIDTLMVAERYRWTEIYTEAFVHGAGRYDFLCAQPAFTFVSPATRQLLERASFSIKARVYATVDALHTFAFPILSNLRPRRTRRSSSSSRTDAMGIPRAWRRAYERFRAWVVQYYTAIFRVRSWPPAHFSRGMILMLQNDFHALYELLVDEMPDRTDSYRRLLSQVLTDFDGPGSGHAPALPRLPSLPPEGSPLRDRRHSREAISVVLLDSYNVGAGGNNRFVEAFKEFERGYGTGKIVTKSIEAREGRWCLVYAVLSTLRGVVVEWEGLRYRWGVEYWLCAELRGVPPWLYRRGSGERTFGLESRADSALTMQTTMTTTTTAAEEDEDGDRTPTNRRSVFG